MKTISEGFNRVTLTLNIYNFPCFFLIDMYNESKESKEFIARLKGETMELAKVTTKGQITIPIEVRRKLGVKSGDKILFVEEAGKIYIANAAKNTFPQELSTSLQYDGIADVMIKRDSIIAMGDVQHD